MAVILSLGDFMEETFESLPYYEGRKSYKILKSGDFSKNYLLFISTYLLGKHHKTIEKRIIQNFQKNENIEESFRMLDEICGRTKKIFKLGTLFDIFSMIDFVKYKKEIFNIFWLQLFPSRFNKKRKYKKAYKLYKCFKKEILDFNKEDFEKSNIPRDSLLFIFYQALVYFYVWNATNMLCSVDDLLFVLEKDDLHYLKHELDFACRELNKNI